MQKAAKRRARLLFVCDVSEYEKNTRKKSDYIGHKSGILSCGGKNSGKVPTVSDFFLENRIWSRCSNLDNVKIARI